MSEIAGTVAGSITARNGAKSAGGIIITRPSASAVVSVPTATSVLTPSAVLSATRPRIARVRQDGSIGTSTTAHRRASAVMSVHTVMSVHGLSVTSGLTSGMTGRVSSDAGGTRTSASAVVSVHTVSGAGGTRTSASAVVSVHTVSGAGGTRARRIDRMSLAAAATSAATSAAMSAAMSAVAGAAHPVGVQAPVGTTRGRARPRLNVHGGACEPLFLI
jgi:hypothetical protein